MKIDGLKPNVVPSRSNPTPVAESSSRGENAARASLPSRAGERLSDVDWKRARSRLLDVAAILREWDRQAQNAEPGLGKVDAICPLET